MRGGDAVVEDRHWRGGEKQVGDGRDEVEVMMSEDVGLMCADSSYCVLMREPTSFYADTLILSVFVLHKPITVSLSVELLVVENIGDGDDGTLEFWPACFVT
jgi:hypothetical protein